MRTRSISLLMVSTLFGATIMRADDDDDRDGKFKEGQLFEAALMRVAELNVPSATAALLPLTGTDPLEKGRVAVLRNRRAQFEIRGAAPNAVYTALFCRFAFLPANGCITLGQLNTNVEGNAEALLSFPDNPAGANDAWAGGFLIQRTTPSATQPVAEFVNGFVFPPSPAGPEAGVEIELKGRILSLNAANNSFRLPGLSMDIVTNSSTDFQKARGFSDLRVGQEVEVKGFVTSAGNIFATRVKVEEKKDKDDDDR